MSNWIKMQANLHEKPEVVAISGELGIDRYSVVGRLHRVWSWFDSHSSDGHAKSVTFVFVDEVCCHTGFATALKNVGWLVEKEGSLIIPHFDRHNGDSAKKRAESAERKRKQREKEELERKEHEKSQLNSDRCHTNGVTDAGLEKRREEKKEVIDKSITPPLPPGGGMSKKPTSIEFENYLLERMPTLNPDWTPDRIKRAAALQFENYEQNGWRDGNGKAVKNWKTKAVNALSYKKPWNFGSELNGAGGQRRNSSLNTSGQNTNQYHSGN